MNDTTGQSPEVLTNAVVFLIIGVLIGTTPEQPNSRSLILIPPYMAMKYPEEQPWHVGCDSAVQDGALTGYKYYSVGHID